MENNNQKYSVTFTGFDNMQQAQTFVNWYNESGEQDAAIWLDENSDLEGANAGKSTIEGNNISVELKLYYKK